MQHVIMVDISRNRGKCASKAVTLDLCSSRVQRDLNDNHTIRMNLSGDWFTNEKA